MLLNNISVKSVKKINNKRVNVFITSYDVKNISNIGSCGGEGIVFLQGRPVDEVSECVGRGRIVYRCLTSDYNSGQQ